MIDLRFSEMPSRIECGGLFYELNTDFRTWIEFDRILREERVPWPGVFSVSVPPGLGWIDGVMEFYASANATPNYPSRHHARTLDLILDGDYIVAAFQQAYGIDLTDPGLTMHWHRFKALLIGLPEDTLLAKAMAYRGYVKNSKSHDQQMADNRRAWTLPEPDIEELKERVLALANEQFPMRDDIY